MIIYIDITYAISLIFGSWTDPTTTAKGTDLDLDDKVSVSLGEGIDLDLEDKGDGGLEGVWIIIIMIMKVIIDDNDDINNNNNKKKKKEWWFNTTTKSWSKYRI